MNTTINSKNNVRRFSWTKTSLLALVLIALWVVLMAALYAINPRLRSTDVVPGAGAPEKYFPGKEKDDLGIGAPDVGTYPGYWNAVGARNAVPDPAGYWNVVGAANSANTNANGKLDQHERFPGKEKDDLGIGMSADHSYDDIEHVRATRSQFIEPNPFGPGWAADYGIVADHSYDDIERIRATR